MLGGQRGQLITGLNRLQIADRALALDDQPVEDESVAANLAHYLRLDFEAVLEPAAGEPPCLLCVLNDLGVRDGRAVLFGKQPAVGVVDRRDLIGDALRAPDQRVDPAQGGLQVPGHRGRQVGEVLRLVDQHLRLVGELLDLVADLLQRANGGQQVLAVVGRIEDRDRVRRRCGDSQRGQAERQNGAGGQKPFL